MLGLLLAAQLCACGYVENLRIRPLVRENALATFDFEMSQNASQGSVQTYTLFPRSLGQIMDESQTEELHLRFGQGWWDSEDWNMLPEHGALAGGIGVELWAWIAGANEAEAWENWRKLTHSLGGYFCASVNFIDEKVTTFPSELIHKPWGNVNTSQTWLMRGALPAEPICTENLTPFLKLLPCRGKAGISSLLDGHSLFSSRWQSMSVDAWSTSGQLMLKQTVSNVVNTRLEGALPFATDLDDLLCEQKPWSRPGTCFPRDPTRASYSLKKLFGREIVGSCPTAEKSVVTFDAPANWAVDGDYDARVFPVLGSMDLKFSTEDSTQVTETAKPDLSLDRSFSGWGQKRGGIRIVFTNDGDAALEVAYLESLPWFMRVYMHTIQWSGPGKILNQRYVPGKDRGRPTQLESLILLAPHSQLEIEYSFDKSLLFIEEYPPDANHGFEVPPGIAIARRAVNEMRTNTYYEVRTSSLLLSLPVPDFSMPYNVIILTSTVMAMAFATLFNLMSRDVLPEDQVPKRVSPLARIKQKLFKR